MRHTTVRWTTASATAVALLTLGAAAGEAQSRSGSRIPTSGDWSVMFTLFEPDDLTTLGIQRHVSDRAKLGVEVDLSWAEGDQRVEQSGLVIQADGTTWSLAVGPTVQWYGGRAGPVSPYLRAKVAAGWQRSHLDVNGERRSEDETSTLLASLAIGAEWYPADRVGIGGHTGVAWTSNDIESRNLVNESSAATTSSNVRTFRSGVSVSFYFR